MNFKTNKNSIYPIVPQGENRGNFDFTLIKLLEQMNFDTKDDLMFISSAFKDLIALLVSKSVFTDNEITDIMRNLRDQK